MSNLEICVDNQSPSTVFHHGPYICIFRHTRLEIYTNLQLEVKSYVKINLTFAMVWLDLPLTWFVAIFRRLNFLLPIHILATALFRIYAR